MFFNKGDLGDDENKKKLFKLAILSFLTICISNVIMYSFLPENMYLNSFGDKIYIKKEIFLLILPAISIIINYFNITLNNRSSMNTILFNIFLPIGSIIGNLYIFFQG